MLPSSGVRAGAPGRPCRPGGARGVCPAPSAGSASWATSGYRGALGGWGAGDVPLRERLRDGMIYGPPPETRPRPALGPQITLECPGARPLRVPPLPFVRDPPTIPVRVQPRSPNRQRHHQQPAADGAGHRPPDGTARVGVENTQPPGPTGDGRGWDAQVRVSGHSSVICGPQTQGIKKLTGGRA